MSESLHTQKKVINLSELKLSDTHAPWQKEFFKNIEGFVQYGVSPEKAKELLFQFIKLSSETPMPEVMKTFEEPSKLDEVGVYTKQNPKIRDFITEFLTPLFQNFTFEGTENLEYLLPLANEFPVTIISNHMSHLDAPAIYYMFYRQGGIAREIADRLVFIAGRLAFTEDFTRLGLYMFDTLLVCSKRDMAQNPSLADVMTKINMRAFRQSQQLQKEGKIIVIFPEGTRSRTGQLISFVDAVYHYVMNKIIIPVSIEGTDEILPTSTFLFKAAKGRFVLGKPILVGRLPDHLMKKLPEYVVHLEIPDDVDDKRQFVIDTLATLVGRNLHRHRHGFYRNLYKATDNKENILIQIPKNPKEKIFVIGHSPYATAISCVLANKDAQIKIYTLFDQDKIKEYNNLKVDQEHFPYFKLPPNMEFTNSTEFLEDATLIIQAVRPWELEKYYGTIKEDLKKTHVPIINIAKGFTSLTQGIIINDLVQHFELPADRFFTMAGANYPQQVMERKMTGFEIAAHTNTEKIDYYIDLFRTDYIYVKPAIQKKDIQGIQLGGALKNIYALTTGIVDGYFSKYYGGNNDNTLFHLSNQFFEEMKAIGVFLGGKEETFFGLSGLSDLMLACFGQDSRDRQWGYDFVFQKADPTRVSSGLFGLKTLPRLIPSLLSDSDTSFPIATITYKIVYENLPVEEGVETLLRKLNQY
ncbi:MAG: 1-acyl-sn-glycerol-3-phosphate acyltransferase [Leptospiraceae bacterium]|nr:1-acyl-sn-glycerol-3-phosphate acyltransferase [Leptospiraceae bacterium]MDW7976957.1 1-acyl-sn-glycerol-3-phosphate acyltransferase [Leptospiraceae bacterium]